MGDARDWAIPGGMRDLPGRRFGLTAAFRRDCSLISLFPYGLVHRVYCETDISALLLAFPFMVIVRVWSPVGSAGT